MLADALDMLKHRRAAVAHELDIAGICPHAERHHAFECLGRFKRDVKENDVGGAVGQREAKRLAVGKFLGIYPDAVKNQRQETPDARVPINDKTEGDTRTAVSFLGLSRRLIGGCFG